VWDWTRKKRLNLFYNGNPRGTSITSLHIINQEVGAMIVSASGEHHNYHLRELCLNPTAEGIVRLYRNYDPDLGNGPVQMVSSFRALNDVIIMKRGTGSGVVTDWKQQGGTLLVSGDSRFIRVWDAHTENQILVRFFEFNPLHSTDFGLGLGHQLR
jgi:regulator-associated protein of mTOR